MHFVTQEEFRHWFTPREGIVDSFVVKVRILFSAAVIKTGKYGAILLNMRKCLIIRDREASC